ncbi:hypothetical protein DL240_09780 [Lujinxingia litoralis]|uniref:Uncharacterized protein n=1 Tax=Lujinxingia litoralis TaxID=2211119 RepID=A0A328C883_9DELT|nr:hypothetical protein [Lujinxingia litoralis]RAL22135.1 hypothetical protein DL240_09780 [Lujinxingia litoralis]
MDASYHPEMAYLIREEKRVEAELEQLRDEFATWKRRVVLAQEKGHAELAAQATERVDALRARGHATREELELLQAKKRLLIRQARRPDGAEVERAEALLEQVRQGGLIDPDEASLEEEFERLARGQDSAAPGPLEEDDNP